MALKNGEWFDRQDHPLLNDLILQIVFEYMRKNDLKECRLVCKKWNELTIPFTRSKFTVTIYGNETTQRSLRCVTDTVYVNNSRRKMSDFVGLFRKNELGIPFDKFKFGVGAISTTDKHSQEFLGLCGNTITGISFIDEDVIKVEDVSQLLKSTPKLQVIQIPNLLSSNAGGNIVKLFPDDPENLPPKLNFLKYLNILSENPRERLKCCPTFIEEILRAAPNIQMTEIYCSLELLLLFDKLKMESSIKTLHIRNPCVGKEQIELLHRMITKQPNGLKLKNLIVHHSQQREFDPLQFITLFKNTVEYCSVSDVYNNLIQFPRIPHLRQIKLSISKRFDSRSVNLNYIFPQLKKLEFHQCGLPKVYDEFFSESDSCPTITSFKLYRVYLTLNSFNHILTLFPTLTQLRMDIGGNLSDGDGAEIIRQIWVHLTQLQSLSLVGTIQTNEPMDTLFSGILTYIFKGVFKVGLKGLKKLTGEEHRREMILKLRNQFGQLPLPSITNLTKLRHLDLIVYGEGTHGGRSYLTDLGAYLAIYTMKELKHLSITQCNISEKCCEILTKDMGLHTWAFKTFDYDSIIPPSK